jgi:hypothetical protein
VEGVSCAYSESNRRIRGATAIRGPAEEPLESAEKGRLERAGSVGGGELCLAGG